MTEALYLRGFVVSDSWLRIKLCHRTLSQQGRRQCETSQQPISTSIKIHQIIFFVSDAEILVKHVMLVLKTSILLRR
jgi:hypothetical protein